MAAVLAYGGEAVLSHFSAAELWRLRRPGSRPGLAPSDSLTGPGIEESPPVGAIDVTVPGRTGRRLRPGLVIHRAGRLLADERTFHCRIPVTTPARTLLDLATVLPRRQLERAVDEAERLRLCTERDLLAVVKAHHGRAGTGPLGNLLREHAIGTTATRNDFEEAFLALCRRHRLPQPEVNVLLLDYVVDFLWRDDRLIVELDGRATHGTRRAFQADRDRDGRLAVAGYRVLRFTWWDVTRRPAIVADRLRRLLRAAAA